MGNDPSVTVNRWADQRLAVLALVVAGVVAVATSGDAYLIRLLTLGCIYGALALGLRMSFGELGELDLGYLALFAAGGYTYGLVRIHWELGELPATLVAIAFVTVMSLLISMLTLRLSGPFFAVTTLGVLVVTTSIIASWSSLTGGVSGLYGFGGGAGTPVPYTNASSGLAWFCFAMAVLCVVAGFTYWLRASRFGDSLNAVRQDAVLFRSLGYNVTLYRAAAATVGGSIAGLSGSVFAMYGGFVSIDLLSMALLGLLLLMVLIGGARSPAGVIIGAFVVTIVPEQLRFVGEHRLLVFGLVLLVAVRLFASGFGPQLGHGLAAVLRLVRVEQRTRTIAVDPSIEQTTGQAR